MSTICEIGPLDGHWTETLKLVRVTSCGKSFVCEICVANIKHISRSTMSCTRSASNLYAHFKSVHNEIFYVVEPIIRIREKNKPQRVASKTIGALMLSSRVYYFNQAILFLFSSPDIPRTLFSDNRFQNVFNFLHPGIVIPTIKTLNNRL